MRFVRLLSLVLVIGMWPAAAAAQVADLPVFNNAFGVTGIRIDGHVAFPRLDEGGGNGNLYAGSVAAGFGPITLRATAGLRKLGDVDPLASADDSYSVFGASVAYRIFGGGVWPFAINIQGGAGFETQDEQIVGDPSVIRYVGNVGVAFRPMISGVTLQPWISGGIRIIDYDLDGADSSTKFGITGGVDLTLPSGLGFHLALDRDSRDVPFDFGAGDLDLTVTTVAIGVHWGFQLPSAGI